MALLLAISIAGCGSGKEEENGISSAAQTGEKTETVQESKVSGGAKAAESRIPMDSTGLGEPTHAVETITLSPSSFTLRAEYIGNLQPWERATLRSKMEGVADSVHYEEGDVVRKGEFLVNISTDLLKVRRDLARANLDLTESNYRRMQQLNAKKLVPPSKLEEASTKREQARFSLRLAELELDKSIAKSPINGTVLKRGVNAGEFLNKGQMMAEILDLSRVKALIHVPEKEIRHIVPGKEVSVQLDALPGETYQGVVHAIGLEADPANRSFPVEVALDNSHDDFRPGMLARVAVDLQHFTNQVLIPRHTVLERATGRVVFLAEKGRAVERTIRTGVTRGQEVQVLSGLIFKERLIITGQQRLTPGDAIRVKETPAVNEAKTTNSTP